MARFLKGIVGAYSGKVGSVVGSSWRSVDYVKSLPKITGKKATVGQMEQRTKFALAVAFLSPIKDVLNLGYSDKLQGKATGYNKALQFLLNNGITGTYPSLEIDYSKVVISKGALSNLMGVNGRKSMRVNWRFPGLRKSISSTLLRMIRSCCSCTIKRRISSVSWNRQPGWMHRYRCLYR